MNENTLKKGAKGESCFCNDWAWALEGANALGMVDETGKYTEGEYRMADGSLVELKSDFRCLAIKTQLETSRLRFTIPAMSMITDGINIALQIM